MFNLFINEMFCGLGVMIHCVMWNDTCNMLVGLRDTLLTVYYYPSTLFVDKELLQKNTEEIDIM